MHVFYAPDINNRHELPEEESNHAVRVLRLQSGDRIEVVDGVGGQYDCKITNPHPKHCEFIVENSLIKPSRDFLLHIAIAPTKNIERLEWFVEKCTEIGIDEITPLLCRFSERKIIKPERIERIIVSAAKQSQKAYFPKLNPMSRFEDFVKEQNTQSDFFIAHCYSAEKVSLSKAIEKGKNSVILIGPEGDFSQEEVLLALQNNFKAVSLGNSRLRTETAGVVACHTVALMNEG